MHGIPTDESLPKFRRAINLRSRGRAMDLSKADLHERLKASGLDRPESDNWLTYKCPVQF